jgi:putative hemolysin
LIDINPDIFENFSGSCMTDADGLILRATLTLLLLLGYAFFVLALICLNRAKFNRLTQLSRQGFIGARGASRLLERAGHYTVVAQAGAFLCAILIGVCSDDLFFLVWRKLPAHLVARFVVVCFSFFLVMLVGLSLVQAARGLGYARPNRSLCLISAPLTLFAWLCHPFAWLLRRISDSLLKAFGIIVPAERELAASAEEIRELVEISNRAGEIDDEERRMIQRIFTFSETVVREIMTPRKDIVALDESVSLRDVIKVFLRERISRVVVVGKDLDDIKGVLMAKDLLQFLEDSSRVFSVSALLRPAYFVSNTMSVNNLLQEFRREAIHFAVVLDEHGGVDGVVTHEDVIEEIVGEVFDEYDSPLEELEVLKTKAGDLLVDGSISVEDLNSTYQLNLPLGAYDTLAGFVIHLFGRIPELGERVEYESLTFKVEEIDQNRVTQIRITHSRN